MLFGRKPTMVSPAGRPPGPSRPPVPHRTPTTSSSARRSRARRPPGHEEIFFGMGCFWGVRADLLGDPRRRRHRRRLPGRLHAQPDVRGDVHRPDRPRRGRPGRLRPREGLARDAAQGVLGEPRPDDRRTGRATTSARSTARRSTPPPTRSSPPPRTSRDALPAGAQGGRLRRDLDRDHARPPTPGSSGTPRTTTRATCTRTPAATATTASARSAYNPAAHGQDAPTKVELPDA